MRLTFMGFVINSPCSERVSILTSSNFGSEASSSSKSVEASISNQRRYYGGDTIIPGILSDSPLLDE
jgi:hypothetical protein